MLPPITVALLAAVAIFGFAVAGIWFVWSRSDASLHTAFTSALSTFAGGVLMAGGLVHMMPDASDVLGRHTEFPLANTLAGATFIALLAVSSITDALSDRKRSHLSRTASVSVLFVSLVFHSVVLGLSLGIASGSAPLCACAARKPRQPRGPGPHVPHFLGGGARGPRRPRSRGGRVPERGERAADLTAIPFPAQFGRHSPPWPPTRRLRPPR